MIDLMSKKIWYFIFSLLIILPGFISLFVYRLNLGIDFTGGALVEYRFEKEIEKDSLKQKLLDQKIEVSSVVNSGENTYIIKTKPVSAEAINKARADLEERFGKVEEVRLENVGPTIGAETARNAFIAVVLASLMIVMYLALAFRKVPKPASSWRFGIELL